MFCPYCGTESTQGLNYCNRCGGNLAPLTQAPAQETRPTVVTPGAAWAAGLTTTGLVVFGLGVIFPITTELASHGVGGAALTWIALFVALTVFGCAGLLLRFWSLLFGLGGVRPAAALPPPETTVMRGLGGPPRPDSLNPAPTHSITEQTTRTLEKVKK